MFNRSAVLTAAICLAATSGLAMAEAPKLSLDPTVITAVDATAPQGALMQGLDKAGLAKPLADAKLKIDGWIESGYTFNNRHGSNATYILPGPFNHEVSNHYMLNQAVVRVARDVDTTKFDVGGMVQLMYGSDAAKIHSGGLGYAGSDPTDDNQPSDWDGVNNFNPTWQIDFPQAYVTVNIPVGNGLQVMVGKFYTLLGYESVDATANNFYSHSWLFSCVPFTHTGVLGSMQISDQFSAKLGVTRGWDMATEDNNGAIDVLGQFIFQPSKQMSLSLAYSIGPQNDGDNTHMRIALDPIVRWQVTDAMSLGAEFLYVFDGGWSNGEYGDVWGGALYAGYKVNDNLALNARVEAVHGSLSSFASYDFDPTSASIFGITLGATITPLPKDDLLKGLSIRPEIRYDFTDSTENKFFPGYDTDYKDQLTFGFDVIFAF